MQDQSIVGLNFAPNTSQVEIIAASVQTQVETEENLRQASQANEDEEDARESFRDKKAYEEYLTENEDQRRLNVSEQLDSIQLSFLVYFMFLSTLLIQITFIPQVKFQSSMLILVGFYMLKTYRNINKLRDRRLRKRYPWKIRQLRIQMAENFFYVATFSVLTVYITQEKPAHILGLAIIVPSCLACCLNCFCSYTEDTPCNSTMVLMSKVIAVLRLLVGLSIFVKIDERTQWEWSTIFWPYWCSFAIQVILGVASIIIFVNTVFNYFKQEAIIEDIWASLWMLIVTVGFVIATFIPIIETIQLFDNGTSKKQQEEYYITYDDDGSQKTLVHSSSAAAEQKPVLKHLGPDQAFVILIAPIAYAFTVSVVTYLLKRQLICWFEHVLYVDDEEQEPLRQTTRGSEGLQNGQGQANPEEPDSAITIHLKTYKFKTPQFIKKLTGTYFKKSKKEEKSRIVKRDMVTNIQEAAKVSSHKKNKSESNLEHHIRNFSLLDTKNVSSNFRHQQKVSKIGIKKDQDFFEFQDSLREDDDSQVIEMKNLQGGGHNQKPGNQVQGMGHKRRFQSVDYRTDIPEDTMGNVDRRRQRGIRQESLSRMSVSLMQKDCCICFDQKPDAVIMECGHGGICYDCGKHLLATEPHVCHLCREDIVYVLKMDLSTVYSNFIKVISATFIDEAASEEGEEDAKDNNGSSPLQDQDQSSQSPTDITNQQMMVEQPEQTLPQVIEVTKNPNQREQSVDIRQAVQQRVRRHTRGNSMINFNPNLAAQGEGNPVFYLQNPFFNSPQTQQIVERQPTAVPAMNSYLNFSLQGPHDFKQYTDNNCGANNDQNEEENDPETQEYFKQQLSERKFTLFQGTMNKKNPFEGTFYRLDDSQSLSESSRQDQNSVRSSVVNRRVLHQLPMMSPSVQRVSGGTLALTDSLQGSIRNQLSHRFVFPQHHTLLQSPMSQHSSKKKIVLVEQIYDNFQEEEEEEDEEEADVACDYQNAPNI